MLPASVSAQIAQPQPSPSLLFEGVRARLLADMNRQSRYTCVQNITRRFYGSDSKKPQSCADILAKRAERGNDLPLTSWDHLQLDVAIADNREVHSWPGAPRFAEDEIRELVGGGGPFGSGDFAAFIAGIFGGSAAVKFENSRTVNGHTLLEYTFDVAQSASNYKITSPGETVVTAYNGSFSLDPQTTDLVQLTVRTAELPADTYACQVVSEIEYERIDIHGGGVLVPRQTNLRTIYGDGKESVGVTSYSGCRQYQGSAVLRFDTTEPSTQNTSQPTEPATPASQVSPFLPGFDFDCQIVTPIDSETPAGRPIEAILRTPLPDQSGRILAPAGAHIQGRLVRLAEYKGARNYFEVDVRLDSVEVNGARLPLYAGLAHNAAPPASPSERNDRGVRFVDLAMNAPRNVGVFLFARKHLHAQQWVSSWRTTEPSPETGKVNSELWAKTPQQISEKRAAQNFRLAIRYSQQATDLLNSMPPTERLTDHPRLPEILAYRRRAIEAGKSADVDVLNDLYPGLGSRFKAEFLEALSLFVHACEMSKLEGTARAELSQSVLLSNEWADWYRVNRDAIEDMVTRESGPASSGWPTSLADAKDIN